MSQTDHRRLGVIPFDVIIPLISSGISSFKAYGVTVVFNGDKMKVFRNNRNCVLCKKVSGSFFAIERQQGEKGSYHLYLYGYHEDTKREVRMNIDHRISLSSGGTNAFNNLQTMCLPCNNLKGPYDVTGLSYEEVVHFRTHMDYHLRTEDARMIEKFVFDSGLAVRLNDSKQLRSRKVGLAYAIQAVAPLLLKAKQEEEGV